MGKKYDSEYEGQIAFFDNFGIDYVEEPVLIENTDGVYNGVLFEFKLSVSNLNNTVFQAIKYLSALRVKGMDVPATFLVVDLNQATAYKYKSEDYKAEIHKVYVGGASKNNDGFVAKEPTSKYEYGKDEDASKLRHLLKDEKGLSEKVLPIDIDENCIVAWAERYYRENPTASKGDFLGDDTGSAVQITGEIRDPRHFKGRINKYTGKTNEKFKYLMDCLNDRLSKKDLGAFYTPPEYARKAAELVLKAVARVPEGNDYIILDRCAGTGNLEAALVGLKDSNGSELISHCVVSTYEYYEYKVLQERLGDKVREIVPPTEANVVYENGMVSNADAMSKEFIENPIIRQYIDDPNCTIVLFENPPYRDGVADNSNKANRSVETDYVFKEMKKILKTLPNSNISTVRDISNRFIWSGYKYYLRQDTDSYILFSPIKYWKSLGLSDKHFEEGYVFDRKYFHAKSSSAIACVWWSNISDDQELIELVALDIEAGKTLPVTTIKCSKCRNTFERYYDRRTFESDKKGSHFEANGELVSGRKCDGRALYGESIVGYLRPTGFSIDAKHISLVRGILFNARGFYIRKDNYIEKMPLFAAKQFSQDAFYERDVYFTTSDGGTAYTKDKDFLKSCLIYTCLSNQNKCLSFHGSDNRDYQNELCFDEGALAKKDLDKYELNADEKELIALWNKILSEAKKTANYDSKWRYGVYQITKELNTKHEERVGKSVKKIPDYVELNSDLDTLKKKLKAYYKKYITPKMFKYELLK